jgi:hypothetical protein
MTPEYKKRTDGTDGVQASEAKKDNFLNEIFPFGIPPQEVLDGTYIIADPELQLATGYHYTSSSVLAFPRNDRKVLVPAVALDSNHPSLNLGFLMKETMEKTHNGGRRWAVWSGPNLFNPDAAASDYTSQRAKEWRDLASNITAIYEDGLQGRSMDTETLGNLLRKVVKGFWFQYYAQELPARIARDPHSVEEEIHRLFSRFTHLVSRAERAYSGLLPHEQSLVQNAFNLVFKIKMVQPQIYIDDTIPYLLRNRVYPKGDEPRSPTEIAADPRGICAQDVEAVYLPDDLDSLQRQVAWDKLRQMGISPDKIGSLDYLTDHGPVKYDSCLQRYGKFTDSDLLRSIEERKLVHVLDTIH